MDYATYRKLLKARREQQAQQASSLMMGVNLSPSVAGQAFDSFGRIERGTNAQDIALKTHQLALEQGSTIIDWINEDPVGHPPLVDGDLPAMVNFEKATDEALRALNGRGFGIGVRGAWLGTLESAAGAARTVRHVRGKSTEQLYGELVKMRSGVPVTEITPDPQRQAFLLTFEGMDEGAFNDTMDRMRASVLSDEYLKERIEEQIDQFSRRQQSMRLGRVTDLTDIRDFRDFVDFAAVGGGEVIASLAMYGAAGAVGGAGGLFAYATLSEGGQMAAQADLDKPGTLSRIAFAAPLSGLVELVGGVPTRALGIRRQLWRRAFSDVTEGVLERTAKGYARRIGKDWVAGAGEEMLQEMAQFFISEYGVEGEDFRFDDETLIGALNAGALGLMGGFVGQAGMGTRRQILIERAARATRDAGLNVKTMGELASVTKDLQLAKVSKEGFASWTKKLGLDKLKIFYQAEVVQDFISAKGLDLEATLKTLGVDPADFAMALANGHRIPMQADGVVRVGLTEEANVETWSENAAFRPDGATMLETKAFKDLRAQLESEIEEQAKVAALSPSRQEIINTFTEDAVRAGYGAEEAGANAVLAAAFFETAAQMYGSQNVTGADLFKRLRIEITREAPQDAGAAQQDAEPATPSQTPPAGAEAGTETTPSVPAAPDTTAPEVPAGEAPEGTRQLDQRQMYEPGTRLDANTYDPAQDQDPNAAGRISTRFPTQASSPESAVGDATLRADTQAMRATPAAFEHNAQLLTTYPGMQDLTGTPDEIVAQFQERVKTNLLWLYENAPEVLRERGHRWYDGARRIVDIWSERYGTNDIAIAGTLAALSPQKDWFMNVSLAERVLDTMFFERDTSWSPEMTATFERILSKYPEILDQIKDRTLQEVIDLDNATLVAAWIRTFSETYHDTKFAVVSPEGDLFPPAGNSIAWNSLNEISKAVSVILNPTVEAATVSMGGRHKVRSFFNNIIAPNSTAGDVTIDTHAVAAALLRPLSAATPEVTHAFGTSLPPKQQPAGYKAAKPAGVAGAQGLYGIYADAYRAAAEEVGILPRQMQSITWEAVRLLYTAAQKRGGVGKQINALWEAGEQSYEEMRDASFELAGGFGQPSWAGSDSAAADPAGQATYTSRVSGRLGPDGARAAGERGRAAGRVPARGGRTGAGSVDTGGADGGRDAGAVSPDGVAVQQPDGDRGDVRRLNQRSLGSAVAVDPDAFVDASRRALSQMGPVAAQVGTDPGDQAFLLDGGLSGYALKGDNIISVFSSPDSPAGVAQRVLDDAVARGGRRLDGFNTFLPKIYARGGFRAVARTAFVDEYAPALEGGAGADWDFDAMGRPDVVFMVYDPENASPETDNVVPDYDAGVAAQDEAIRVIDFDLMADTQRGDPELAMLDVQRATGGGVLSWAVEHIGDLTHRMGERGGAYGAEFVEPKVRRGIDLLRQGYGFAREVREQAERTAEYRGQTVEEYWASIEQALQRYAEAHRSVPVFNELQRAARDAAVAIGEQQFDDAAQELERILEAIEAGTYDEQSKVHDRSFNQGNNGFIQFMEGRLDQGAVITILKNANQSTLPHELGHFFLEALLWMASQDGATSQLKKDFAEINRWFDRDDDDLSSFSTEQHEMWAENFEKYLATGKAPTPALKSAFYLFKRWLLKVYAMTPFLQTSMDPELVDIFDRMLATEEEIEAAKIEESMGPLLLSKPPGMASETYEAYRRAAGLTDAEGSATLLAKAMKAVLDRHKDEFKKRRAELTEEYAAGMSTQKHVQMVEGLRAVGAKLDRDQLLERFGPAVLSNLERYGKKKNAIFRKGGVDLEMAAELGGYDSVDGMIGDLTANGPLAEMVERKVRQTMANEADDLLATGQMRREAVDALHNNERWNTLAMEETEIRRQIEELDPENLPAGFTVKEARELAASIMADTAVQVAENPEVFLRAERQAGRAAQEAFGRVARAAAGAKLSTSARADLATAHAAKRKQMLNSILYAEAKKVQTTVRQIKALEKRVKKSRSKGKKPTIASPFLEELEALLEQYDFRKLSAKQTWKNHGLQQLITEMEEAGIGEFLLLDPDVVKRMQRKPYGALTAAQLRGLKDSLDNLEHLGRKELQGIYGEQNVAFTELKRNALTTLDLNFEDVQFAPSETSGERRARTAHAILNSFQTPDTLARKWDKPGKDDVGFFGLAIKVPLQQAMARVQARQHETREAYDALLEKYYGGNTAVSTQRVHRPEIGVSLTKAELLAIALNTGNAENMQRLMSDREGWGFTMNEQNLQQLLDNHMTEADWHFVQDVWDLVNSFWGEIASTQRARTGVYPKKVDAKMGVTAPSFVRGGYYPIRYDKRLGVNVSEFENNDIFKMMRSGQATKAQTRNGHLKERKAKVDKLLDLSLSVGISHLNDVILDLEMGGALSNAWRLLNDPDVSSAFKLKGLEQDRVDMLLALQDAALGDRQPAKGLDIVFRHLRGGLSISRMAFSATTLIQQVLGLTNSAVAVGKGYMAKGIWKYATNMSQTAEMVSAVSPFMVERQRTMERDIIAFSGELDENPIYGNMKATQRVIVQAGFAGIQKLQYYAVDLPTWMAAYMKHMDLHGDPVRAAEAADLLVSRAQGSGLLSDRSGIERGSIHEAQRFNEIARLLTTFGSYMISGKLNLTLQRFRETDFKKAGDVANLVVDMMLMYVAETLLALAITNRWFDEDEDDEGLPLWMAKEIAYGIMGTVPVLRDAPGVLEGYGGGGSYGDATDAIFSMPGDITTLATGLDDNPDAARNAVKGLMQGGGVMFHLPTVQLERALTALLERDMSVRSDFRARDLAFGRRD